MPDFLLSEVAEVVDCEHKTAPAEWDGLGYAYSIGTRDIKNGRIDYSGAKTVSRQTWQEWSKRATVGAGDLILAREAPVGQVGYVTGDVPVCLGQRTVLVRPNASLADPRYLHYRLLAPLAQQWMQARAEGSTVVHLNVSDVRQIPVPDLPSVCEQRRIAFVLQALDDLIDTNKRCIALVRELAQTAFERLVGTSEERLLGDVADVNPGKVNPQPMGRLSYLDIASVSDGWVSYGPSIPWSQAPGRARRLAEHGDIVWSTVRPNRRAHGLILRPPDHLVASTGLAVLRGTKIGPATLFAAVDRPEFVDRLVARAEGSAYPAVRSEAFRSIPIPVPAEADRASFESTMWPLWEWAGELGNEVAQLTRTREELLPLLMSGRVRPGEVGS